MASAKWPANATADMSPMNHDLYSYTCPLILHVLQLHTSQVARLPAEPPQGRLKYLYAPVHYIHQ